MLGDASVFFRNLIDLAAAQHREKRITWTWPKGVDFSRFMVRDWWLMVDGWGLRIDGWCCYLEGKLSVLLVSCFTWSGASESLDLLLSHNTIRLAYNISIILISTLFYIFIYKRWPHYHHYHHSHHSNNAPCTTGAYARGFIRSTCPTVHIIHIHIYIYIYIYQKWADQCCRGGDKSSSSAAGRDTLGGGDVRENRCGGCTHDADQIACLFSNREGTWVFIGFGLLHRLQICVFVCSCVLWCVSTIYPTSVSLTPTTPQHHKNTHTHPSHRYVFK